MHLKNPKKNSNTILEPKGFLLGISEKGILFINEETRALKKHEKLPNVPSYSYTADYFYYRAGDPNAQVDGDSIQRICVFQTTQGEKICEMLTIYQSVPYNQCSYKR